MIKYKIPNFMVILLLIFILFLYAYNLAGWLIHDDEGGYLYQAWRMSEGGVPYRDFYSPKEPLFLFTGFVIFKFLGPGIFWIRMFSVFVTIFTSYLIFLIGKRIYNSNKIAVISLIAYLALPVVVFQARFYRPDAYVVFFSTLALFLFIKAWQDNKRAFFIYSGVFYAVALGYKLSGILGVIASIVFILYQAMQEKRISINARSLFPFIGGFLGALVLFLIAIQYTAPSFLSCVIGHQAKQLLLTQPHLSKLMFENIKEFLMINPERQYGFRNAHPWLIIFSLPIIIQYLFLKKDPKKIFSFYIFNIWVLLFNPYDGQVLRYLLYFMPVATLVFVSLIFSLLSPGRRILAKICGLIILVFILLEVFIPGLIKDKVLIIAKENGTSALAKYIKDHTDDEDYVIGDYGDIIFNAKRKTTPLMSGMSKSTVSNGVITSDKLIEEFNHYPVKIVFIHKEGGIPKDLGYYFETPFEPHHFVTLINSKDGSKFMSYLQMHYWLVNTFNRSGQIFDIYMKK